MGKTEANVKQGNKIYIVDPNPPEMEKHSPEDMFLYIKFKATNRNRSTYLGKDETTQTDQFTNTGTEGEINFIATQVNFNADGQITPDPQQTYATTSYTNIGGMQESNSRGNLEGFGIKSIDIKYNASLVPTVDMTFTDLRGSALFDVTEHNDRKSPYSIFFKMPYPIFTLSVKGYFGKTVDYCLHMINWTSNFDGTTGNFDISANFVGFQQAFLADMVLGNIIGVVNTSMGYNKLMKVFEDERNTFNKNEENKRKNLTLQEIGSNVPFADVESGKKLNIRKIDDFFVRVSKLQIETEAIKRDSKELNKLKILNEQLSKLKTLQTFIGKPIRKKVITQDVGESEKQFKIRKKSISFEEQTNSPLDIVTSSIPDNVLKQGKNYLSIRDYIIFNTVNVVSVQRWFTTLTEIIDDYRKFKNEAATEPLTPINLPNEKTFLSDYQPNKDTNELDYKDFIDITVTVKNKNVTLDEVFNTFEDENRSPLNEFYITSPNPNADFPVGGDSPFTTNDPNTKDDLGRDNFKEQLNLQNLVKALDFRKRRSKLQMKINALEITADKQYEIAENEINEKLNKQLDFSPKIKDVFRILCNNTDAMLQTLADITKEAEKTSKKERRKEALEGYITDTPSKNKNSYGWPRIHQPEAKGAEEVYMGDIKRLVNNFQADFPEYRFVDEVFDNLVARRKKLEEISAATNLKNGLDTDNWFPLNPIDYDENPFLLMNNLNVDEALKEELIKQLLVRSCLCLNYSNFTNQSGSNNIGDYATLEGINANKTIFSNTVRHMIIEILEDERTNYNFHKKSLIDIAKEKGIIREENGHYVLIEDNFNGEKGELPQIGAYPISGYRNSKVNYIIINGTTPIVNNGKLLWELIPQSTAYKRIMLKNDKPKEVVEDFYISEFNKYNYQTKLFFNVWIPPFGRKLWAVNEKYDKLDIDNMANIDLDLNTGDKYINQIYPNDTSGVTPPVNYGTSGLTTTDFYKTQSNEGKAILLLSTFPFKNFKDGVLKVFEKEEFYVGARILNLPSIYLYFIGGLLYRSTLSNPDPINFSPIWPNLYTSRIEYLWKLGVLGKQGGTTDHPIEPALLNLPKQTKDNLINFFLLWVKLGGPGGFKDLEKKVITYTEGEVNFTPPSVEELEKQKEEAEIALMVTLENLSYMVVFAPAIFDPLALKDGLSIPIGEFNSYRNTFQTNFRDANATNLNNASQAQTNKKDNKSISKIKLEIYNYFKNINDKWVASSNGKSYNACSGQNEDTSLIDYFKFLNRGWKDIGNEAVINLNSLLTLGNNLNTNMYFFISKVLRDSNFLFQILPTFIDFKNPTEVQDMFKPVTVVSDSNDKRGPIYTCIYIGAASELLDIGDENEYYYSNDGFTFTNNLTSSDKAESNKIPADFNLGADEEREFALVAFRVAFGAENQGIFKNVSLNQQEHRETGEYFRALSDLVDKRGGTQRSYQGTDLLRLFKTRSYTCKVEALGCMNIQPLMYFDLQNVPFFHGAYLITSVSHNITPNHMTTSFTGLRQSKYNSSPVTDVTAYLDIDLNEGNNEPPVSFTNLNVNTDTLYNMGVRDPDSSNAATNWQTKFTAETLKNIGVPETIANTHADQFRKSMVDAGILSNAQAMIFLSIALTQSDYFNKREETWSTATSAKLQNCIVYKTIDNPCYNVADCPNPGDPVDTAEYILAEPRIPLTYANGDQVHWVLCTSPAYNRNTHKILFDGEGPGGTEEQQGLDMNYGNKKAGDAYRFRPRGYIPIVGKGQYSELFSGTTLNSYWNNPNNAAAQPLNAFQVATSVWSHVWSDKRTNINDTLKNTSYNQFVDINGSASMYSAVSGVQTWYSKSQQEYFTVFEKVLSMFDLLNPGYPR